MRWYKDRQMDRPDRRSRMDGEREREREREREMDRQTGRQAGRKRSKSSGVILALLAVRNPVPSQARLLAPTLSETRCHPSDRHK